MGNHAITAVSVFSQSIASLTPGHLLITVRMITYGCLAHVSHSNCRKPSECRIL